MVNYYAKYLKYKNKYITLANQRGGASTPVDIVLLKPDVSSSAPSSVPVSSSSAPVVSPSPASSSFNEILAKDIITPDEYNSLSDENKKLYTINNKHTERVDYQEYDTIIDDYIKITVKEKIEHDKILEKDSIMFFEYDKLTKEEQELFTVETYARFDGRRFSVPMKKHTIDNYVITTEIYNTFDPNSQNFFRDAYDWGPSTYKRKVPDPKLVYNRILELNYISHDQFLQLQPNHQQLFTFNAYDRYKEPTYIKIELKERITHDNILKKNIITCDEYTKLSEGEHGLFSIYDFNEYYIKNNVKNQFTHHDIIAKDTITVGEYSKLSEVEDKLFSIDEPTKHTPTYTKITAKEKHMRDIICVKSIITSSDYGKLLNEQQQLFKPYRFNRKGDIVEYKHKYR